MVSVRSSRRGRARAGGSARAHRRPRAGRRAAGPGATTRASAQSPQPEEPTPQTDASVPASDVTMIGATPEEPGAPRRERDVGRGTEKRARHRKNDRGDRALRRRIAAGRWPAEARRRIARRASSSTASPLAGQMTPHGAGVLAGALPKEGGGSQQAILVRKPGGAFEDHSGRHRRRRNAPARRRTAAAQRRSAVRRQARAADRAARRSRRRSRRAGRAGQRKAAGVEDQVLHWDGTQWTSEPIEIPTASQEEFRVLAIGASSPDERLAARAALLQSLLPGRRRGAVPARAEGEGEHAKWVWKPVTATGKARRSRTADGPGAGRRDARAVHASPAWASRRRSISQLLTVTSEGVWIDGRARRRPHAHAPRHDDDLLQARRRSERSRGHVEASWCLLPAARRRGAAVPVRTARSAARRVRRAASPGRVGSGRAVRRAGDHRAGRRREPAPGRRIVHARALARRGHAQRKPVPRRPARRGVQRARARAGWAADGMPVHLTTEPAASTPDALAGAVSPSPARRSRPSRARPSARSPAKRSRSATRARSRATSRARAGCPKACSAPASGSKRPRLRAVAWPTPNRAYAVGDHGQMWLWRGETGLWEKDPATPLNFRGNLLGVAFDPNNPACGYAVGSDRRSREAGTGRRCCATARPGPRKPRLPPQVQRRELHLDRVRRLGGDRRLPHAPEHHPRDNADRRPARQRRLRLAGRRRSGRGDRHGVPGAVAGLPDGGAAFTTVGGPDGPQRVSSANRPARPGRPAPRRCPARPPARSRCSAKGARCGRSSPAGGISNESEPQTPAPGFPPSYLEPFPPIAGGTGKRRVLRQTATGWSDETHELNPAGEPQGGYTYHDLPYRLDPILAVLVSSRRRRRAGRSAARSTPTNSSRPAIWSAIRPKARHRWAKARRRWRRKCRAQRCRGTQGRDVRDRRRRAVLGPVRGSRGRRIGPDVWLKEALRQAANTGARAFLYTGPRVTTAETQGPKTAGDPVRAGVRTLRADPRLESAPDLRGDLAV